MHEKHQCIYGNTKKMSFCGSFTVYIMLAELVVIKQLSIPTVREE